MDLKLVLLTHDSFLLLGQQTWTNQENKSKNCKMQLGTPYPDRLNLSHLLIPSLITVQPWHCCQQAWIWYTWNLWGVHWNPKILKHHLHFTCPLNIRAWTCPKINFTLSSDRTSDWTYKFYSIRSAIGSTIACKVHNQRDHLWFSDQQAYRI